MKRKFRNIFTKSISVSNLGNLDKASKNFKNAYNLKPDSPFLLGNLMHINSLKCDWKNYNFDLKKILKGIEQKKRLHHLILLLLYLTLQKQILMCLKFG